VLNQTEKIVLNAQSSLITVTSSFHSRKQFLPVHCPISPAELAKRTPAEGSVITKHFANLGEI